MELIIVTGMSGAGKSRVIDTLEDIGFYCVDNMPAKLVCKFAEIAKQSEGSISKMAVVVDARGGNMFKDLCAELDELKRVEQDYRLLFLDCDDSVLLRRYKETRRKHPLLTLENQSLESVIKIERKLLSDAWDRADYVLNTTLLSPNQLKEKIRSIFLDNVSTGMLINCMSFGFKFGYPVEADLTFDVRCLPNPFYIDSLRDKTGLNFEVSDYVMQWDDAKELLNKLNDLVDFLLPLYVKEGKTQLVISIGCTGGKHRSVTFAEAIYKHLHEKNKRVTVNHRDITK